MVYYYLLCFGIISFSDIASVLSSYVRFRQQGERPHSPALLDSSITRVLVYVRMLCVIIHVTVGVGFLFLTAVLILVSWSHILRMSPLVYPHFVCDTSIMASSFSLSVLIRYGYVRCRHLGVGLGLLYSPTTPLIPSDRNSNSQ